MKCCCDATSDANLLGEIMVVVVFGPSAIVSIEHWCAIEGVDLDGAFLHNIHSPL